LIMALSREGVGSPNEGIVALSRMEQILIDDNALSPKLRKCGVREKINLLIDIVWCEVVK